MRAVDYVALGMIAVAFVVCLWAVVTVVARVRWERDFGHDKALIKADPSGDLWREKGRL
jgi:hypothetical protein